MEQDLSQHPGPAQFPAPTSSISFSLSLFALFVLSFHLLSSQSQHITSLYTLSPEK